MDTEAKKAERAKRSEREFEARVAERVMGWRWATLNPRVYTVLTGKRRLVPPGTCEDATYVFCDTSLPPEDRWYDFAPHYTTDEMADHAAHDAMRGSDYSTLKRYYEALYDILYERWSHTRTLDFDIARLYPMNFYECGDFSRAALTALEPAPTSEPTA